jgi:diacylglycerol kinase (ATP)
MLRLDFVVNPNARRVRLGRLVRSLRRRFAGHHAEFYDDANALPDDPGDERIVVAVGGDGTVNRVLNSPRGAERRVALLPLGTSNDLANNLGVPTSFERACDLIESCSSRSIDLLEVNGRRFATCGGVGFAVDVAARANAWKSSAARPLVRALGPLIYPLAAARQLMSGPVTIDATLSVAGADESISLSMALVSNLPRFGKRFSTSPRARPDDGLLHLGIFAPAPGRLQMARVVGRLYHARPDQCPGARQVRSESLTLTTPSPVSFFGDGEVLCVSDRFKVCVTPGALRLVCPRPMEGAPCS